MTRPVPGAAVWSTSWVPPLPPNLPRIRASSRGLNCISLVGSCAFPGTRRWRRYVRSSMRMAPLTEELRIWQRRASAHIGALPLAPRFEHIGRVLRVGDGIATVAGLPDTRLDEL